jgi:hypothetical protein
VIATIMRLIGVPKWAAFAIAIGGIGVALAGARIWHNSQIDAVRIAAMQEQAEYSAADFEAAWKAAEQHQANEIAAQLTTARIINKEQTDGLKKQNDRISSAYADLRQLWAKAKARENPGRAGHDGAIAVPADAGGNAFAAAQAAGWVDFETAAALAEAADRAIAADDAKAAWWLEQCRAWRGPKPEDCR